MSIKFDKQINARIHSGLRDAIYRQSMITAIASVFASGILVYLLQGSAVSDQLMLNFFLVCLCAMLQLSLFGVVFGLKLSGRSLLIDRIYFGLLVGLAALWGSLGLLSDQLPLEDVSVFVLFIAVIAGIFSVTYAPVRPIAYTTSSITLLPTIFTLARIEDVTALYQAMALLGYLVALMFAVSVVSKSIADNYRTSFELERQREIADVARLRAERAIQLRGQFFAALSHEIRTPINVIQGMSELLERRSTGLDPVIQKQLRSLSLASDHLNSLVSGVLDLSKLEAGELYPRITNFDLTGVCESVVALFAQKASAKNIDLKLNVSRQLSSVVSGDELRVRQILINLLSNAVKYTDSGGVVLSVTQGASINQVKFEVTDTGKGIPKDRYRDVFRPYTQDIGLHAESVVSTGLGLAIVSELVALLGGDIALESEVGKGSTFTVLLSLSPMQGGSMEEEPSLAEGSEQIDPSLSVLVADDSELNLDLFESFFNELGLQVTAVTGGREAVDAYVLEPYDVVVLDLQMPDLGGLSACSLIREFEQKEGLEPAIIIVQSADYRSENRQLSIEAGANYALTKPFKLREISSILIEGSCRKQSAADVRRGRETAVSELLSRDRLVKSLEIEINDALEVLVRGDREALAIALHRMKGNCAMSNADRLRDIIAGIEEDLRCTEIPLTQISDSLECLAQELNGFTV